jgi:hypothetical protein
MTHEIAGDSGVCRGSIGQPFGISHPSNRPPQPPALPCRHERRRPAGVELGPGDPDRAADGVGQVAHSGRWRRLLRHCARRWGWQGRQCEKGLALPVTKRRITTSKPQTQRNQT